MEVDIPVDSLASQNNVTSRFAQSFQEFHDIFWNAPIGLFKSTPEGRFLAVNPALALMYGFNTPEEIITTITDIGTQLYADPGDRKEFRRRLERYGQIRNYEYRLLRQDGSTLWVSTNAQARTNRYGDITHYQGYTIDITERKETEGELHRLKWMFSRKTSSKHEGSSESTSGFGPDYGDLSGLNTCRLILDGVGRDVLVDIVSDFLDLLDTSVAVYEQNGDYALGIFASGWCQLLDRASRQLCNTEDNCKALSSGRWLCHESCWDMAREAMEKGEAVDRECIGGIRIYAVPIRASGEVIGSINAGYGNPPQNLDTLCELAEKYLVGVEDLKMQAAGYESRPHFIIELAKKRIQAGARLIGEIVQRKQAEQKLQTILEEYETVFQSTHEALFLVEVVGGTDFRYIRNNRSHQRASGFALHDLRGKTPHELLGQELGSVVAANYRSCVQAGSSISYEEELDLPAGKRTWHTTLTPVFREGRVAYIVASCWDITQRKHMEKALHRKTEEQAVLLDGVPIHLWYLADADTYGAVNQAHADFLGWPKEEMQFQRIDKFLTAEEAHTCRKGNLKVYSTRKHLYTEEWLSNAQGIQRLLAITKTPHLDAVGNVEYVVCSAADITEQKKYEIELQYLSLHDQLTGLYNRAYLEAELDRLKKSREFPITVICMDLDGLKLVNDTLGHENGDEHIKTCAKVLRDCLRASDIVARTGGDEFVAMLPKTDLVSGETIAGRIQNNIQIYNHKHPTTIPMGLSIGLSCADDASSDLSSAFKQAEDLMYRDKLNRDVTSRSQIMKALMAALEERDFITSGHAHRLEENCLRLGRKISLSSAQLTSLKLLAQVHDLGKVGIPDHILFKPGPLTKDEWKIMRQHPEKGFRIAQETTDLAWIADLILKHHEHWDGTGYPLGLSGEEIPIECRILAIVDSFDAMTNDRPYRKAMPAEEALAELEKYAGTQFDPQLVGVFLEMISSQGK
jgi:diguanylate cyclase (GGDEF)-like protein/PAS domain S-box-containing protein